MTFMVAGLSPSFLSPRELLHEFYHPMPQIKVERIDTGINYPCPCCRRGQIYLITLTEALGCQKCQKIFVIQPDGHTLEQLSTYPMGQVWRWNGRDWYPVRQHWPGRSVLLISLGVSAVLLLIGILLTSRINLRSEMLLWWTLVAIVVGILCAGMLLSLRSRRY
jgi:hypothetical protein